MNINDRYHSISEWATAYRSAGLNVIPLYNYSKNPQLTEVYKDGKWIVGWKDLQERKATDFEFNHWFLEGKPTGLGVITGRISGIVVVDVDSYKSGGMKFHMDSTWKATSARGGTHFFFKYVEPIKTTGLKEGVFIEIKSDGGFIVLAPSEVWIDEAHTKKGKYKWSEDIKGKLDLLPPIHQQDLENYTRGQTAYKDMHELIRAPIGTQHNNLRDIANKMLARFKQSEWDIADGVIRAIANDFNPPHPQKDVDKIIADCKGFMLRNKTDKPFREPKTTIEVARARIEEKKMERTAPLTGFPELDESMKGFLPGHLYTMTGVTNIGKTACAVNFAVRVAKQQHDVLYYALEPENTVVDYIASVRLNKRFDDLTESDILVDDPHIRIYGKEEISTLKDLLISIRESPVRYGLAIVDHVGYFIRRTEGFLQEQSNTIKELVSIAKEKRMAILLIAHMRKMTVGTKKKSDPSADDISGSAAFKQDSTEVMIITRNMEPDGITLTNEGTLSVVKTKAGRNGRIPLLFSPFSAYVGTPGLVAKEFRESISKPL